MSMRHRTAAVMTQTFFESERIIPSAKFNGPRRMKKKEGAWEYCCMSVSGDDGFLLRWRSKHASQNAAVMTFRRLSEVKESSDAKNGTSISTHESRVAL